MVSPRPRLSLLSLTALIGAVACGTSNGSGPAGSGAATGSSGAKATGTAASGATGTPVPTGSGGAAPTGSGGATSTGSGGSAPTGSGGATPTGSAGASAAAGTTGDQGAATVQCGATACGEPSSCCQTWTGSAVSGAPTCVPACDETQAQLCGNAADCQQTNTSTCGPNGLCVDTGQVVLGNPIGDGGTAVGSGPTTASGGPVPTGYPTPTAANSSMCKTVPISATACAGTPAGNTCIECLFGGATYDNAVDPPGTAAAVKAAGNYLVTVELGGAAAAQTQIWSESSRGLLAPVTTAAGKNATYAFAVNVRGMEGQPNHAGGPGGYPGLDLFFTGPTATPPAITGIGYALATAATQPIIVYIASDSTTCDQTGGAFGGWGQMLPSFFNAPVEIANYANSGASSDSFIGSSALWGGITSHWKAGDYVIIQFGHNDKTITDAQVETNLEKYVAAAKAANVIPILVSPPARVQFGSGTTDGSQSSLHAASASGAATKEGVAYIDLTSLSTAWYNTLGSQAAALKYHANGSDATHTNLVGAQKLASLVANSIKSQNLPLAKYLRPEALTQ
jgi:lysophospholipase L1-like esterase